MDNNNVVLTYVRAAQDLKIIPDQENDALSFSRAAKRYVHNLNRGPMDNAPDQETYLRNIASRTRSIVFFDN